MQQKFYPTPGQRVCSEHCDGRNKTYENNIPTIVPKIIEPNVFKEKKVTKKYKKQSIKRRLEFFNVPENKRELPEMKHEIKALKKS